MCRSTSTSAMPSSNLPQVQVSNEIHTPEHSLETHLPFLQIALKKFSILPIVTGQTTAEDVCAVLEKVWGWDRRR